MKNLINKLKNKAKKGIVKGLAALVFASAGAGCGNIFDPLGPHLNIITQLSADPLYNGQGDTATMRADDPHQDLKGSYKVNNTEWSTPQELTNNGDGTYTMAIPPTTNYGWLGAKGLGASGRTNSEGLDAVKPIYMNEDDSDTALDEILAPLLKPASTTDYDIISYDINVNHGRNGTIYNDDANITIYDSGAGGNQRDYVIDVQGSISDVFNQENKDDADAVNVSYRHLTPEEATDLENLIKNTQSNGWPRTF